MINAAIFLSGISAATFAASALFFIKFWRASRDRLFLCFSVAFFLMAIERIIALSVAGTLQTIRGPTTEATAWVYLVRLLAFVVIMLAILEKNKSNRAR